MRYWFRYSNDKLWLNIEREVSKGKDLFSLSMACYALPKINTPNFLTIRATLAAWKFALTKLQPTCNPVLMPIPLGVIDYCKVRITTTPWSKQGIHFFDQLSPDDIHKITNKLIAKPFNKNFDPKKSVELPRALWEFFTSYKISGKRGISHIYKLLSSFPIQTKTLNMIKWEKDLSQTFTWEEWQKAIHINSSSSACVEHWENAQKILNRWYLTPYRLSKIFPSSSPICWRCESHTGNLLHTLWDCKTLSSFWNNVSSFIASFTGNLKILTPELALLGLNLDVYPPQFRTIVANFLTAARLTITKLWKSTLAPNLSDVVQRLNTQAHYELMLAHRKGTISKFIKNWNEWITHPRASNFLKNFNNY